MLISGNLKLLTKLPILFTSIGIRSYVSRYPRYPITRRRKLSPLSTRKSSIMGDNPLVWVDCEMTGLDPDQNHIIEICCILTDRNLDIIEPKGFEAVIHYPKEVMDTMNDWCIEHHGKSGLTQKVLDSTNTLDQTENAFLEYLKTHIKAPRTGVLAGNSIHQDRLFLYKEFPKVIDYLHYRQVDVSTIKEVGYRHNPELMTKLPQKRYGHTARSDIEESIAELKWYYDNYLIPPKE